MSGRTSFPAVVVAVVMVLAAVVLSTDRSAARGASRGAIVRAPAVAAEPLAGGSSWTLVGCWKSRPWLTTCLDVYTDPSGNYWICRACGTTRTPSPGKCRSTTLAELNSGTWCSSTSSAGAGR